MSLGVEVEMPGSEIMETSWTRASPARELASKSKPSLADQPAQPGAAADFTRVRTARHARAS